MNAKKKMLAIDFSRRYNKFEHRKMKNFVKKKKIIKSKQNSSPLEGYSHFYVVLIATEENEPQLHNTRWGLGILTKFIIRY